MAEYEMQKLNLPHSEEEPILFPRLRLQGCIDLDYIARQIADGTTYASSEVEASVKEVARWMAYYMGQGYSVKVDGVGTFTPSLGLREGKERESGQEGAVRRNAASICVRDIKFRADRELVKATNRECKLERSQRKFQRSSTRYTPQERLALALRYLETHETLSVGDYCALTGLLQDKAARELRGWAQDPESGIATRGRGTHKVYARRR